MMVVPGMMQWKVMMVRKTTRIIGRGEMMSSNKMMIQDGILPKM